MRRYPEDGFELVPLVVLEAGTADDFLLGESLVRDGQNGHEQAVLLFGEVLHEDVDHNLDEVLGGLHIWND